MSTESKAVIWLPAPTLVSMVLEDTVTGMVPLTVLPVPEAPTATPTMTAVSSPELRTVTLPPKDSTAALPSSTMALWFSTLTRTSPPTAVAVGATATLRATSARRLLAEARMFTSFRAVSLAPEATRTFASVSDTSTPTTPAALAEPPAAMAAEAEAATLIRRSRFREVMSIPPWVLVRVEAPIWVRAFAWSTMTATVPPAATFAFPPEADRVTSSSSVSTWEVTVRVSWASMEQLFPTRLETVLLFAMTLTVPPTLRFAGAVPVEALAATVTTITSKAPEAVWL